MAIEYRRRDYRLVDPDPSGTGRCEAEGVGGEVGVEVRNLSLATGAPQADGR